jgi:hypothetical protein
VVNMVFLIVLGYIGQQTNRQTDEKRKKEILTDKQKDRLRIRVGGWMDGWVYGNQSWFKGLLSAVQKLQDLFLKKNMGKSL